MPGKKGFLFLAALLFTLLICVRLILLTADPPYDLSTSGGPYGDPGGYSFNARNKVMFGTWEVDGYNMMYLSFPPHLITYLSFRLLGVGLAQQNLVPVLFSMGSLVLFFLILLRRFSYAWALGGTALLGLNHLFLMYSRVANRVMPPLFFILLGLYFLQKKTKTRHSSFLFAAGMSFFLALISKSVIFYALAGIGIAYLVHALLQHEIREIVKQIAFLAAGVLAPGIVWLFFVYIPHRDFIHSFSELNVKFLIPSIHLPTLLRNFWIRPPILLEQMPIVSVLAALGSLVLLLNLVRDRKKMALIDWIFLLWFLVGYVYYAIIQQRFPRHVIPQIIPLIFLTVSLGYRLLNGPSTEKKPRFLTGIFLFLWLLFPVSMGLKYLAKGLPHVFTGQNILNLSLLACSAALTILFFMLVRIWPSRKKDFLPLSLKQVLVFLLMAAILIFQGIPYLQWALHPQFQFRDISRDLGKALPKATIAGLWAPVICLENKHRAHEYFPGAINDTPDFFQKYGITHVFTTTHAGEDKTFQRKFPDVMARAKLLARYHIWIVEALLYDVQPMSAPADPRGYEAELFTQKENTPRFDPKASGAFSVLCQGKQKRFVVSIPTSKRLLPEGTYNISFWLKKQGYVQKAEQRMARIDAVSEKRKKALAYKDVYPEDLSGSEYQSIRLIVTVKTPEDITFRVFTQGNGDFWVDRVDIQQID